MRSSLYSHTHKHTLPLFLSLSLSRTHFGPGRHSPKHEPQPGGVLHGHMDPNEADAAPTAQQVALRADAGP